METSRMSVSSECPTETSNFLEFVRAMFGPDAEAACKAQVESLAFPQSGENGALDLLFSDVLRQAVPSFLELSKEMANTPYSSK